jgi:zinc finger MYM-type protein 2/3/4
LAREEGIPGFEDSSDGESANDDDDDNLIEKKKKRRHQTNNSNNSDFNEIISDSNSINNSATVTQYLTNDTDGMSFEQQLKLQQLLSQSECSFKWTFGVRAFHQWLTSMNKKSSKTSPSINNNNNDNNTCNILKLKNEDLNLLLTQFLDQVRKNNGDSYAPESLYYLCLGIQYYLQENDRPENIFFDQNLFDKFQVKLNQIALSYQIRIDNDGQIISRIEEEILWESKQLGAHSPFVLLNTILYFNTKYFFLSKVEHHKKLSFLNVKKHSKRNIGQNGEDFGESVFLRYYPTYQGLEQVIYEQCENYDNPLRCPVELYNFYLSKW